MSLCDVCHKEEATVHPFCRRCADAILEAEAERWLRLIGLGEEELKETSSRMEECTGCAGGCEKCVAPLL